ncbi:peptidyl-prolyl cis-trans isomerase SurA [Wenyingzhuangia heitensis]|uniref:Peptidyl-prolyl cis-trans isomerase SurA n=1 Tax=Wenyingzhuangia heitensis TaxID=1487859 RepID=A0ABX0UBS3_9FLAO|nr:peptidylprolyl isomerase [Wenyingzhuangia heitensis]NIJ45738.1 peptidyl-prolyl cis-trans isomerase SurA [Wenyingzhuangia heitensis]
MKFIKKSHVLMMLLLSVGFVNAQQKIKVDGVAAVVGDKIILDSDIVKYKQEIEARAEGDVNFNNCEVMEDIMTQKLLAHQAVIDSILVSDAEVNAGVQRTLEHFKSQMGDMNKVVSLYGFDDLEDLTSELTRIEKENLLIQRERQSVVSEVVVTPDEIRFFYNDLKSKGDLPSFGIEVELSQITIDAQPTEEAVKEVIDKLSQIRTDIENGYSMRLKAILYSEDPGVAQNGGLYTITRQSQFVKEFKEAAFSMEEGEVSEPFKSQFGYHILQVEKIKGQQRDVRHLLIQPKIEEEKLTAAKDKLEKVRAEILAGDITFEEAVVKYSDDKATRLNKGKLVNPYTNDAKFELNKMDPKLFAQVDKLSQNDITAPFYEETREGEKMYKIIKVTNRVDAHEADFAKDYVKIQQLALQKKEQETLDKWYTSRIKDTYVKLSADQETCDFKYKWLH